MSNPKREARIGPIEKGVPIPPRQRGGVIKQTFDAMEIGDSVVLSEVWDVRRMVLVGKSNPTALAISRKLPQGGWRVWKVAREKVYAPKVEWPPATPSPIVTSPNTLWAQTTGELKDGTIISTKYL